MVLRMLQSLELIIHARLKAGMVITVEPGKYLRINEDSMTKLECHSGIYVPPTAQFPKHFHNIGIRIEVGYDTACSTYFLTYNTLQDDVLVGQKHSVVLSVSAPKEVCPDSLFSLDKLKNVI